MAKYTATFAADGTAFICNVVKPRNLPMWQATIFVYGTFGAGTIAWQWSPDGGTTKLALKDFSGTALTTTTNDSLPVQLGTGDKNSDRVKLYAVLTGSTAPSLTVGVFDNN
jgi:hypothetical protein